MSDKMPKTIEDKMERRSGLFILITIVILIAILFIIGKERNIFKKRYNLITTFDHGSNIDNNTNVTLAGIKVGKVHDIYINEEHKIEVVMSIHEKYKRLIREDSVATPVFSLLTGAVIDITIGSQGYKSLEDGSRITSTETSEIADKVGVKVLMPKSGDIDKMLKTDLPLIITRLEKVFGIIDNLVSRLQDPSAKINQIVFNLGEFVKKLNESGMVARWDNLLANAGELTSDIKEFTRDLPLLQTRVKTLMKELDTILGDLGVFSGYLKETAPDLPEVIKSVEEFITNANEVIDASKKSFLLKKHFKTVEEREQIMINEDKRDMLSITD